jgi:hypothetical protein
MVPNYNGSSRPHAVLQRGNSTDAYISYTFYCPKPYHSPDDTMYTNSKENYHHHITIIPKHILAQNLTQDSFRVCGLGSCTLPSLNKCSLRRSSITFSFRATETNFTGARTQDTVTAVPVISSKQTTLILATLF